MLPGTSQGRGLRGTRAITVATALRARRCKKNCHCVSGPTPPRLLAQTRWWFLALLQCLAGYLFAMGGRQIHQATVAACYVGHVEGTGAALDAVVRSLQLPWDEASTVDRCASEAVLDETLGPGWTTEVRPDSPGPLTWATDTGVHLDQPLSCRSRSAVPALLYSKERQALGPALSGAHLIGMSGVQSPTLAEAGLAQRLSEDNRSPEGNVAGSVPLPDAFDQASTSLFGVYDSAIVQSASGFAVVNAAYSQALNCASRSADPAAADADNYLPTSGTLPCRTT